MSELKLLNCPFCGGKAEFVKMGILKDISLGFVRCTECEIRLRQGNCTEDFVRDEWNRRTPMDNIVEKLKEELKLTREAQNIECIGNDGYGTPLQSKFSGEICALIKAINIVKQEINNGLE